MRTCKELARDLIEPFNRYLPNNTGYVTLTQNQLDELEFQIELLLLRKFEEGRTGETKETKPIRNKFKHSRKVRKV